MEDSTISKRDEECESINESQFLNMISQFQNEEMDVTETKEFEEVNDELSSHSSLEKM